MLEFDSARGQVTSSIKRVNIAPGPGLLQLGVSFTRDGRWMFFEWTEEEGDIYVADLIVR